MKTLFIAINSKYIHPAMGVFQIIANTNYDVSYHEFTIKDKNEDIIKYILENEYDVLAFSIYIWNTKKIKYILKYLKTINYNKIIYCGGPEASYDYEELIFKYNVNYITKGEGENSFNHLIDYLVGKREIKNVDNLYYLDNNQIKYTYNKPCDLNVIKHDYSLIKDFKNRICYIESSRGCYYNCAYCMASLEKPVRFFPIETVKKDLLFLLENNARIIKFLDRSFNVNRGYMLEILKFINEHDNGVSTFQFEIVGDLLSDEEIAYINTMRKGYLRFEIGIQSTNDITMKAINRHQNFNRIKENILSIRDNVAIHTDLIAGLPFENYERFKQSFNETFLLLTEELQLGFLKELKGTEISDKKDEYGYIFDNNPPFEVLENSYITNEELEKIKLVEESVDKFYNSKNFTRTFKYLFTNYKIDPFSFFMNITLFFKNNNIDFKKIQFDELTNYLYESISNCVNDINKDELFFIMKQDYLSRLDLRPKIFWNNNISKQDRREMYLELSNKFNLNIDLLYKNARYEYFIKDNIMYIYLITYNPKKEYYYKKEL